MAIKTESSPVQLLSVLPTEGLLFEGKAAIGQQNSEIKPFELQPLPVLTPEEKAILVKQNQEQLLTPLSNFWLTEGGKPLSPEQIKAGAEILNTFSLIMQQGLTSAQAEVIISWAYSMNEVTTGIPYDPSQSALTQQQMDMYERAIGTGVRVQPTVDTTGFVVGN